MQILAKFLLLYLSAVFITSCSDDTSASGDDTSASGDDTSDSSSETPQITIRLNAFKDFSCTNNWTNRDRGLGLVANSSEGTCKTTFSGVNGKYKIVFRAQTEFDGTPKYKISVNGVTTASGKYPYSTGVLTCDCFGNLNKWRTNCPDVIVDLTGGTVDLVNGDVIQVWGKEVWHCGTHGAYAKWKGVNLVPVSE